ncbi:MAG: DUF2807 domain-containing protein [Pseudomonadota bacterium]
MALSKKAQWAAAVATVALGAGLVATAGAAPGEETARGFPGAKSLAIEDFTGVVEIAVTDGELAVVMTSGGKDYPVEMVQKGGAVTIAGEERPKNFRVYKVVQEHKLYDDEKFEAFLKDYPRLAITLPRGADLSIEDVIGQALGDDGIGAFSLEGGYVEGAFGDVKSADVEINHAGELALGVIDGTALVRIKGSGDFSAEFAKKADLSVAGSGDIALGPIAGDASINISGSGDIDVGDVTGVLSVSIGGSGDVSIENAAKGASLSIAGSGDVSLASVNGPTNVNIAGSGDIDIDDGIAEDLSVSIAGAGDFAHGGASTNLNASILGGGSVSVRENKGALVTSGQGGEVIVGGKTVNRKRR